MPHARFRPLLLVAGAASALAIVASCAGPSRKTLSQQLGSTTTRTDLELEAEISDYALHLIASAESAALGIRNQTNDRDAYLAATWMLVRVNTEVTRSLMYPDPTASLVDLWALAAQFVQYYETTPELAIGEQHRADLLALARDMHARIDAIAKEFGVGTEGREIITAWVREHPIEAPAFTRPSVAPLLARFVDTGSGGVVAAAEDINLSTQQIAMSLQVLNNQLPKQLVWRAELMLDQRLNDFEIGELTRETREALTIVDEIPQLVRTERQTILAEVDEQREAIMNDVDARIDRVMGDVDRRIASALADVDRQREQATADAADITADAMTEIRAIVADAIARSDALRLDSHARVDAHLASAVDEVEALADRLTLRVIVAGALALLVIGGFTLWRDARQRRVRA